MTRQSEELLEEEFVQLLQKLGYEFVTINNESQLIANLKIQLEKHNKTTFSNTEFNKILNKLKSTSVFENAKTLREKQHIIRDNGENCYYEFFQKEFWCRNEYQVTRQVTQEGINTNRYDVTILVNGLPLVQIELKRRGIELKEAFNQINRYQKHTYGEGQALFQYIQLFVISNGVNTKYYSNFGQHIAEFLQTFYWTDEQNKPLNNLLEEFAPAFMNPCHISKMISKYIVLNETDKRLMVLRPYQYYAVEKIIQKVKDNEILQGYDVAKNGYIWHTTGSGKTLTSFKASQILSANPTIKKVVFVVDRKDLDYQTNQEYDKFSKGCVSSAENTEDLIQKFKDPNVRIIVATIQKLKNAIMGKNIHKMSAVKAERMVFIFDECHRSQFGETHNHIINYFSNIQLFGFTGTPILKENANGEKTTASLFGQCLHKYVITDAIRDENVLKFSIEYISTFKMKEEIVDLDIIKINEQEVFKSPQRQEAIAKYIIKNHALKTQQQKYCAMMCVQDIDAVIAYYEIFKRLKEEGMHDLKIATIFSYAQNEEEINNTALLETINSTKTELPFPNYIPHRRELLENYIEDFNAMYSTTHSAKDTQGFYNYYNDVAKKAKVKDLDILLVANMFLTGFDSKNVNTLYVDKNLQYHGLIQAFSRTNRIHDINKTQGNIVCFRNLQEETDEAIALFSDKNAIDEIIVEPYEHYVAKFEAAVAQLLYIAPTVKSVDNLQTEEDQSEFILAFRNIIRLHKKMNHYTDFSWDDLSLEQQTYEDYISKYLDIKDKISLKTDKVKTSILDDIDFELELIRQDTINVTYIMNLLSKYKDATSEKEQANIHQQIVNLLQKEESLRSKRDLILQFIEENMPNIRDAADILDAFQKFVIEQQRKAFEILLEEENLHRDKTEKVIKEYCFSLKKPVANDILSLRIDGVPSIKIRNEVCERILSKTLHFAKKFYDV